MARFDIGAERGAHVHHEVFIALSNTDEQSRGELIGDGLETNPTSEVFACVESIEDVVGKLVCTDCQGYGMLPNTQSHTCHPRKCPLCKGAGFLLVGL
jgi:DnaJ-class molecular chaperone